MWIHELKEGYSASTCCQIWKLRICQISKTDILRMAFRFSKSIKCAISCSGGSSKIIEKSNLIGFSVSMDVSVVLIRHNEN